MFKRIVVSMAVGGMLMAVSVGAAAALNVQGLTSQAGVADDFVCQPDTEPLTVSVQGYEADTQTVQNLVVDGINADCEGETLGWQIRDDLGNQVAIGAVTIGASPTYTENIGPIPVADIYEIAVVINGF